MKPWVLWVLGLALAVACVVSLTIGAVPIPPTRVLAILVESVGVETPLSFEAHEVVTLTLVRAPRVLLGALVGAALGIAGATLQGLFRNPLADPGLIGVSSGAALAAITVTMVGAGVSGALGVPATVLLSLAAFGGGLGAVLLVYRIATFEGRTSIATMLLAGIAINAVAAAATGVFVFASDDQELRDFIFWTLGGLGGVTWSSILTGGPLLILGLVAALFLARPLNALLLGQAEALHLGVDVDRVQRSVVWIAAITVGAAVALAGIVGFIGLITPHLVRMVAGPDHRIVLPGAALLGAALLVVADLASRTVVAPAELPVGVVTALLGGPFFLWLVVRDRRRGALAGAA